MTINIKSILLIAMILCAIRTAAAQEPDVVVGAARIDVIKPMLEGKRVGLLSNHTGMVGDRHILDILIDNGINVTTIFSPEHGFRGTADAGEKVDGSRDSRTGLPIVSLYGKKRKPTDAQMAGVDVIVCDIQDVGLRFYTYYITMLDLMESAAEAQKPFIILDRPNPNGMTVDGPVLDMSLKSGVGRLPIPVIHGMTLGELARMAVGEQWFTGARHLDLSVVPCLGYTHRTRYHLPVTPSPNLPSMTSVYLYPSTCLFEGTVMSLGRGTDKPFCIYGHPSMTGCRFSFRPRSIPGAKNPPLLGRLCRGRDLSSIDHEKAIAAGVDLSYIIDAYNNAGMAKLKPRFFTPFFDKLIGNTRVREMIETGHPADEIRATWADDVKRFKILRQPYLLYPE